jgi:hypothetical protein
MAALRQQMSHGLIIISISIANGLTAHQRASHCSSISFVLDQLATLHR